MKENQILSCISFILAAGVIVFLSACSPSDSAPYYLNKQDTASQSSTDSQPASTSTGPAAPATTTPATTNPATTTPVVSKASCASAPGQSYPDGTTILAVCRPVDSNGTLSCFPTQAGSYFTCKDGKWFPQ